MAIKININTEQQLNHFVLILADCTDRIHLARICILQQFYKYKSLVFRWQFVWITNILTNLNDLQSMTTHIDKIITLYKNTINNNYIIRIWYSPTLNTSFTLSNITYQQCPSYIKILYDPSTSTILIACTYKLQIWSQSNLSLLQSKIIDTINTTNTINIPNVIRQVCLCGGYLVVLTQYQLVYYSKSSWGRVGMRLISDWGVSGMSGLACVDGLGGSVGFRVGYGNGSYGIFDAVYTVTNGTNGTNGTSSTNTSTAVNSTTNTSTTTNISNSTNNTNTNTSTSSSNQTSAYSSNSSIYIYPIPPPPSSSTNSTQSDTPIPQFIIYLNQLLLFLLNSNQWNQTTSAIATTTGITSSNPILTQLLKPFLFFLDQFWLYKFHIIAYTQLFQYFTTQTDILNQLRIKPSFLQTDISISIIQQQNNKYYQTSPFNYRAPNTIFIFQSLKDVYIFNLFSSVLQFVVIIILRKITKKIKYKSYKLKLCYEFLHSNSIWWSLLISSVQSNIVVITFYSAIQMLCFYSFQFFGKVNLIFTVFIFFLVLCYSYLLYELLFRYQKKQRSSQVLSSCIFGYHGFFLQTALNCLRRLNSGFIHGSLINRHFLQLGFLVMSDLLFILVAIKMKQQFKNNFLFLLTFVYFVSFFGLDLTLFVCTQIIFAHNLKDFQINQIGNFVIAIFVIIISIVCVIRFMLLCASLAYRIYGFLTSQQKITETNKKDTFKQNIKTKNKINTTKSIKVQELSSIKNYKTSNKIHDQSTTLSRRKINLYSTKQNLTKIKIQVEEIMKIYSQKLKFAYSNLKFFDLFLRYCLIIIFIFGKFINLLSIFP